MEQARIRSEIVSGGDFPDKLKRAMKSAIRQSGRDLRFLIEQEAKEKIRSEGAIWLGRLLANFEHKYERRGKKLVLVVYNESEHAPYVEWGASYEGEGPPVAPLIPWVQYHLSGWEMPDNAGSYPASAEDVPDSQRIVEAPDGGTVDAFEGASPEVVQKAFWLQETIKKNGLDAVGFMDKAERWARSSADDIVRENVELELARL